MAKILNEVSIKAPLGKVWGILTNLELLASYDPTVSSSRCVSELRSGLGAKRKVVMKDGKNWFEEKVTEFNEESALTYSLTDCSFPISGLSHRYTFRKAPNETVVMQTMQYTVKFGLLGRFMDFLMIRRQSDAGIKKFFAGLKAYAESH